MSRIALIAHGRFRGHRTIGAVSEQIGYSAQFTERRLHAEFLAWHLHPDVEVVVVAGGDGTLHEVVNGLMRRPPSARPSIAILPMGSGNDTARALGISAGLSDLQRRLRQRNPVFWDVIRLTFNTADGQRAQRFCINIADLGFGGMVMEQYDHRLRSIPFGLGYLLASFHALFSARPAMLQVVTGFQEREHPMLMACLCNSKWFGKGLGISPQADPSDGLMDITLVGDASPLDYLRFLPALWRGKPINDPRVEYLRSRAVLLVPAATMHLEIDGEYCGVGPVEAEVIPRQICFLA